MKKPILSPIVIRLLYCLMGGFLFLIPTIIFLDRYADDRELTQAKIISLQSCFFSLTKMSDKKPSELSDFCNKYSKDFSETFASIQGQSNQIFNQKYKMVWEK